MGCSLYTCKSVEERRKGETHARARSPRLAGPGRAGRGGAGRGVAWRGVARRGEAMGAGARRAREWSAKIRPKASQVRGFLLPFIFCYEFVSNTLFIERPSRLRDAVTLGESSL